MVGEVEKKPQSEADCRTPATGASLFLYIYTHICLFLPVSSHMRMALGCFLKVIVNKSVATPDHSAFCEHRVLFSDLLIMSQCVTEVFPVCSSLFSSLQES